jgi:hypothetical protein
MLIPTRHREKPAHHKSCSRACSKLYLLHSGAIELSAGLCVRAACVRGAGKRPLASSIRSKATGAS